MGMTCFFWIINLDEIVNTFPPKGDRRGYDFVMKLPSLGVDYKLDNQKFQIVASDFLDKLFYYNDFNKEERKVYYSLWGSLFWLTYGDADLQYFNPMSNFLDYPQIYSWDSKMISELLELNKKIDFERIMNYSKNVLTGFLFDKISNFESFIEYHNLWIDLLEKTLEKESVLIFHIE